MTHCPHCNSPVRAIKSQLTPEERKALRSRGTDGDTQAARIVAALKTGPKSTDDFRALGIYQSAARINGLRKVGYVIETKLYDGYAADGYSHARMGLYTLIEEPLAAQPTKEGQEAPKTGQQGGEGGAVVCE